MSTTSAKSIRTDYLSGAADLQPFYQYSPNSPDFAHIMADKSADQTDRKLLQEVIREQYAAHHPEPSARTQAMIDALGDQQTFTLTTGHQLVLFAGPLFTTYKVFSIIKLARQLQAQYADKQIVPIFWIHTEDHDFEEVNHYYQSFSKKITYPGTFVSQVGNHELDERIASALPDPKWAQHYQAGKSWTAAFRSMIFDLFDAYGLVMLDADHPKLKGQFRSVIQEELAQQSTQDRIERQSSQLNEAGYPAQITAREINLFYLDDAGRNRILRREDGHGFKVDGRDLSFSEQEMAQLVAEQPERFSPNVSLRPLYQEMILPNLAYTGGWGELSYWMQLKGVFEQHKVNFPLLLPRFSASILTETQQKEWESLGFEPADIQRKLPELYQQYLPTLWDDSPLLKAFEAVSEQMDALHTLVETDISATLARSVMGMKVKAERRMQTIHKKAGKVIRSEHPQIFEQIEALKLEIQPDGAVQERILSLFSFPNIPPAELMPQIWEAVTPLNFQHHFLSVKEL